MNGNKNEYERILQDFAETGSLLCQKGWAERNAGNISIEITADQWEMIKSKNQISVCRSEIARPALADKIILITTTGSRMRDLARRPAENICALKFDSSGGIYTVYQCDNGPANLPSSELPTHLAIHERIGGAAERAVLHCHCTELIALTHIPEYQNEAALNKLLMGMHPELLLFIPEGIAFVPYQLTGSASLAEASANMMAAHKIAVWEKHGVTAAGATATEAYEIIEIAAKAAKVFFMCAAVGMRPEGLTDEQIEEVLGLL